jgi:MoxR-like ATPase
LSRGGKSGNFAGMSAVDPGREALRAKLGRLLRALSEGLVERQEPARWLLLAALSGEHALLVGPPGSGKRSLARRLRGGVEGGGSFERVVTRSSEVEEVFGPLVPAGSGGEERRGEGYLPTAVVGFLGEAFRASSALLNPLLVLLDDRVVVEGAGRVASPLLTLVGACSRVPEGDEPGALLDRFLFRCLLPPVSEGSFDRLLDPSPPPEEIPAEARISLEEIEQIQGEALGVFLPDGVRSLLLGIRRGLGEQGIRVSERRWKKIGRMLRVAAYCDGRDAVGLADGWLVLPCLWEQPGQIAEVEGVFLSALDAALVEEPRRILAATERAEEQIKGDLAPQEQALDGAGRPLFHDEQGGITTEEFRLEQVTSPGGEPLYKAPMAPGGKAPWSGLTAGDLWENWFQHRAGGREQLDAWIREPSNRVTVKAPRHKVKKGPAEPELLVARREQVTSLLGEVRAARRSLADLEGEAQAPLWLSEEQRRQTTTRSREVVAALVAIEERLARAEEAIRLFLARTRPTLS